jgi:hypothetical protein
MAEEKVTLRELNYRELLPWLIIFRAFGVAIDPKKLVLAAAGVLAMATGWFLLGRVFTGLSGSPQVEQQAGDISQWPWQERDWKAVSVSATPAGPPKEGLAVLEELLHDPLHTLWQLATDWRAVLRPVQQLIRPFRDVFSRTGTFMSVVFAFVAGLWAVVVWAIFGGAITRIAAVQLAREEKIGLGESLKFSTSKFLSFFGAPVIPLGFTAVFALLCMIGGWISLIPGIGPLFAGVLWFLPMLAGFVMAIIIVAWAAGWPLMYSTISVEGSDAFDALSRSWAYAFQRPWHYLFYALAAAAFGSLCLSFVRVFADLLVYTSAWAVAWGSGSELVGQLLYYAPDASGWRDSISEVAAPTGATRVGAILAAIWLNAAFLLLVGFVYSYFWSASTAIYYLLRRVVDNTELNEVYLEGAEDDYGMPAGEPAPAVTAGAAATPGGAASEPQAS